MRRLGRFLRDVRGGIAIMTGIGMVPFTLMTGMGIEYARIERTRIALQDLADAAALAAARIEPRDTAQTRKARAEAYFAASAKARNLDGAKIDIAVGGEAITARAVIRHDMVFRMLGDDAEIAVKSEVGNPKPDGRVLDVVMCIDATTSMGGTIAAVQKNARTFPTDLLATLKARKLGEYDLMRTRVIYFRDIVFWRDTFESSGNVWAESAFFSFPKDLTNFQDYVNANTQGGPYNMDYPESSHECLYKATTSSWFKVGDTIPATNDKPASTAKDVTPLIIMWTDDIPKAFDDAASRASPADPAGMPSSEKGFSDLWKNPKVIDQKNKLFVLFGPCSRAAWKFGMSLDGAACGGTVTDGNTNMISRIADAVAKQFRSRQAYVSG